MTTLYKPDLCFTAGAFQAGLGLSVTPSGKIAPPASADGAPSPSHTVNLVRKAILPGFVNTHSHAFQRLIRGLSESRRTSGDDFWSWRSTMYRAAASLTPDQVYDVARMAFLEMAKAGITTVGEFHYLHNAPDGTPYADPNTLSHQVIEAAQSVGLRIVLLRSAYLRSGYQLPPDPGQRRFYETADAFCANTEALLAAYPNSSPRHRARPVLADPNHSHPDQGDPNHADPNRAPTVHFGVAPHSIRAVPRNALHQIIRWARSQNLPLHMHLSEQVAENTACLHEYGQTPVALLAAEDLLGPDLTAIHAIHIRAEEIAMLARAQAAICSCPTTERNLGDGILAADQAMRAGIPIALGSDSQAQIDPLEDARQLDYHLRLQHQQRAILDQIDGQPLAPTLFACATRHGARSLGLNSDLLEPHAPADFITVDLDDPSIAGHSPDDLLSILVFGLNRSAIRDVFVGGKQILHDGHHALQAEIISRYRALHRRLGLSLEPARNQTPSL